VRLRSLSLLLSFLTLLALGQVPAQAAAPTRVATAALTYNQQVHQLTNAERTRRGLRPLAASSCANSYAVRWAHTLASTGALKHQALVPIMNSCRASTAGENVAYGNVTPAQLVAMWMRSPGHRANILNPRFNQIGIGAVRVAGGRVYGVQVFVRV
jgi:uncharacterized protein YkwD